jgi:hypothetical protein
MEEEGLIISYCTGGLGNRLRGLASCYVISQNTGKKLKVYWDNLQRNGCLAKLDELFDNKLETISLEEMNDLSDCFMCLEYDDALREQTVFGTNTLIHLTNKFGAKGKHSYTYNVCNKNVVVFNIEFLRNVDLNDSYKFLRQLKPVKDIKDDIDKIIKDLDLSKNIVGVHARGSDFNVPVSFYIEKIRDYLKLKKDQIFFLSSDDKDFEKIIVDAFPGKIKNITKQHYITRDTNLPWSNHNSFTRDREHVKEAIKDLFVLASTDIRIYHPSSTYCEIARILSNAPIV